MLVIGGGGEAGEGREAVGAVMDAVRRAAADGQAAGDRRRDRARPHARQRCRVDRAVVGGRGVLAQVRDRISGVPAYPRWPGVRRRRGQHVGPGMDHALRDVRVSFHRDRRREERGDPFPPSVEPLEHPAAPWARGEVKLRAPCLAAGREPEGVARDQLVSVGAAATGNPGELLAAGRQDPLDVALDDPRGDPELAGDLVACHTVAVQQRDLARALIQALEDRERELVQLGSLLALDHELVRRRQR